MASIHDPSGTRRYKATCVRQSTSSTSTAAVALPTLDGGREVMLNATARCFIRFGASDVGAAADDTSAFPVEANMYFHLKVPSGATHFRVIRDTADGVLRVHAVD